MIEAARAEATEDITQMVGAGSEETPLTLVRVSVRRVHVQMSSAYPLRELFERCHRRLMRLKPASG